MTKLEIITRFQELAEFRYYEDNHSIDNSCICSEEYYIKAYADSDAQYQKDVAMILELESMLYA